MSKEEIKALRQRRGGHKGVVTYFHNRVANLKSFGELQSALNRLRSTYSKFDEVQSQLEILDDDEADGNERMNFEDDYGVIESVILDKLDDIETYKNTGNRKYEPNPSFNKVGDSVPFKLPEIPLVKFDGDKLKWLNFRDVFKSLIHESKHLSEVAKFYYLHGSIKDGKAFALIESIPITNENYITAWNKLYDFYNNEIDIQQHHVKLIYDIKRPNEKSASSLSCFIETIERNLDALAAFKVDTSSWTLMLNHHIVDRLDADSKVEVIKKNKRDKLMTTKELLEILKIRVRILESLSSYKPAFESQRSKFNNNKPFVKPVHTLAATAVVIACQYCDSKEHSLTSCSSFTDKKVSTSDRYKFVKKHNLCTNCLSAVHRVSDCKSGNCKKCDLKHNTLLHFEKQSNPVNSNSTKSVANSSTNTFPSTGVSASPGASTSQAAVNASSGTTLHISDAGISKTILGTAVIYVEAENGIRTQCRILIDSCSQHNFATEQLCQLLKPQKRAVNIPISGLNEKMTYIKNLVNLNITSRTSDFTHNLNFLVIPKITGEMPSTELNCDLSNLPSRIKLADPLFYTPNRIDLLIGVELYYDLIYPEQFTVCKELPTLRNTVFGYIVAGKLESCNSVINRANTSALVCSANNLPTMLEKFWQLEEFVTKPSSFWSAEEKLCEAHYVNHTTRDASGRYSVALPMKDNIASLGLSSAGALQQFHYLEKKLSKNNDLRLEYEKFMSEFIDLGHMEVVAKPDVIDCDHGKCYFLPHHAVFKESSTTTKTRVVFNASNKTSTQLSLNDVMLNGPTIQQDLVSIVLRFRKHIVGFSADIAKMYRQILVHENQRDLQRIWWRDVKDGVIKCFRLKTVTYGTKCAPFLAIRTLFQLADDENQNYPEASRTLKRDFYVDDILSGAATHAEAVSLKNDLISLLASGGFDLRKWESNSSQISANGSESSEVINVLGLKWNTEVDSFKILPTELPILNVCSKRNVLSELTQLFDPLGFIAPVVVIAKQLMQVLWKNSKALKSSWDDILTEDLNDHWNTFKSELCSLNNIDIPRCITIPNAKYIECHAFGDASKKAYGCVIYIRSVDEANNVEVRLLCAKSKIAPIKEQTIPRLELCAAVLTAKTVSKVVGCMELKMSKLYFWSDSEVTLLRIKSSPGKLEIFEANRISALQEISSPDDWYYVPTAINPADIISRGMMPNELIKSDIWWNGPKFLYEDKSNWPKNPINLNIVNNSSQESLSVSNLVEAKGLTLICNKPNFPNLIDQFSDLNKLLRISAIWLRFINNLKLYNNKAARRFDPINATDINNARIGLIKFIQQTEFSKEFKDLKNNKPVYIHSRLKSLSPFIDSDNIIRVGGRLENSDKTNNEKHPVLLPGSSFFSLLIARNEHVRLAHTSPQQLLYEIRQSYWIINGRNLCRKIVFNCVRCFRVSPRSTNQLMGQLPAARVVPSRPFHHTGVDYCGPFMLKCKIRSKCISKALLCIFVCFATKAVHIEVVGDLSTATFLAAFRRFVSRRSCPCHMYSDNGTNFVGAKGELAEMQALITSESHNDKILNYCTKNNIEWHTIPPRSPHFGGLWEAAVKTAKRHLKCITANDSYTLEELTTLVTQIEACMNSRPLTPMSSDPSDLNVLTPGHFLVGGPLTSLPDPSLLDLNINRLDRFQKIQFSAQIFWKRWKLEYLSELQQKTKWTEPSTEIKTGIMVLLKDDCLPPLKWQIGRINQLHPGQDGITRAVTVKTANGEFKRALAKVCILPMEQTVLDSAEI